MVDGSKFSFHIVCYENAIQIIDRNKKLIIVLWPLNHGSDKLVVEAFSHLRLGASLLT